MKKIISGKVLLGIASLFVVLFLSSCLSTDNTNPSRLRVYLQLKGTTAPSGTSDTTLVAGNDSLTISKVRLIGGKIHLIREKAPLVSRHVHILRFSIQRPARSTGNAALWTRGGGQVIAGTYHAIDFRIIQAADSLRDKNIRIDDDFYNGGRYSIIIEGTFNHSDFTFKSKQIFEGKVPVQPSIDMPKHNAAANFIIYANVRDWFLKSDGQGFLDPSDKNNTAEINSNIKGSFHLKTQSRGTGVM